MFDDSIGKETNGFEWVNPNEWGQVNVSVLEGDQGEAQLSLDSLKVWRQLVRLDHAKFHLRKKNISSNSEKSYKENSFRILNAIFKVKVRQKKTTRTLT